MPNPAASPAVSSTVGLKNMVIAPLTVDTEETLTYGDLQLVAGAIEASITPQNADPDVQYADDAEFARYEALRDEGIDLARLEYDEIRQLRRDLQLIFQDPYSSLNPRMTVGNIIGANIMDLTLIMPLCAVIQGKPMTVERQGMLLDIPACLIICAAALIPALVQGKFKRWIGYLIGGLYIAYLAVMFTCFGV